MLVCDSDTPEFKEEGDGLCEAVGVAAGAGFGDGFFEDDGSPWGAVAGAGDVGLPAEAERGEG
jgi:hypothetical protein